MIESLIGIALAGWGHIIRDGEPSFKTLLQGLVGTSWEWLYHLSTQLARVVGALVCTVGFWFIFPDWHALLFGLMVLIGFYTDTFHGNGEGAATLEDAGYLIISGITSLVPLALSVGWQYGWYFGVWILVAGIIKPAIWFATKPFSVFFLKLNMYTTEAAAGLFGAWVALTLVVLKSLIS